MWNFFSQKKDIGRLKLEVLDSFDNVKKDFNKIGEWIRHLDDKHMSHEDEVSDIKNQLLSIQGDIMEIKDFISFFGPQLSKQLSKQHQTGGDKQVASLAVRTVVQTAVQTDILDNLTVMERAIVWALLNSDMKLSYEDLAALLGKSKSTIRGQINNIKQKGDLILEEMGPNGKKRLYVPETTKNIIVKSLKVKVKESRKDEN